MLRPCRKKPPIKQNRSGLSKDENRADILSWLRNLTETIG